MFKIGDFWGLLAAGLTLILIYLVLDKSGAAVQLGNAALTGTDKLARTLQGR